MSQDLNIAGISFCAIVVLFLIAAGIATSRLERIHDRGGVDEE